MSCINCVISINQYCPVNFVCFCRVLGKCLNIKVIFKMLGLVKKVLKLDRRKMTKIPVVPFVKSAASLLS